MHVVELSEQGMLILRMNLDLTLGPGCDQCLQCWEEDGMQCLLKRESGDDVGISISLLDAALLLGGTRGACDLVALGVDSTRLDPEYI